jgi:predicted NBD/HSP70 family sugar kinase
VKFALAVDIGGTKASIASVDPTFNILQRREISTGSASNLEAALGAACDEVLESTSGDLVGVGIGSAGPLDLQAGTISPVNIPTWRPFKVVEFFQVKTGSSNVVLHGDGMAVADAEHQLGAGRGSQNMLGMVVSTGVGGGLILDGNLIAGHSGNVSFFGHHSINHTGIRCVCGRVGCVEAYASGPSMVRRAEELGWDGDDRDMIVILIILKVMAMIVMMVMLVIVISNDDSHVIVQHLSDLLRVGKCWSASELRRPPSRRQSTDELIPRLVHPAIHCLLQYASSYHHMLI